jgi:hypothetical protein
MAAVAPTQEGSTQITKDSAKRKRPQQTERPPRFRFPPLKSSVFFVSPSYGEKVSEYISGKLKNRGHVRMPIVLFLQ